MNKIPPVKTLQTERFASPNVLAATSMTSLLMKVRSEAVNPVVSIVIGRLHSSQSEIQQALAASFAAPAANF